MKPCPWCHSSDVTAHQIRATRHGETDSVAWVECMECRAKGPSEDTLPEAIEAWDIGPGPRIAARFNVMDGADVD